MKIYFYGCHYDSRWVPHECAVLAEGLTALGHQCFGEIDKLREMADASPIIHASDNMVEADVIIMDSTINLFADSEQELQKISSITHTHTQRPSFLSMNLTACALQASAKTPAHAH